MDCRSELSFVSYDSEAEFEGFQIIEPPLEAFQPKNPFPTAEDSNSPLRILLVEDDPDQRFLISEILKNRGVYVVNALDGADAIRKTLFARAHNADFDAILMDIQMPRLDGLDSTATLRHQGYEKPIIAFSARPLDEGVDSYKSAGCNDFILKSNLVRDLYPTICNCISSGF